VRRRSGARRLTSVLIVLVIVVGGLLLVADRAGAAVAERSISDQVKKEVAARGGTTSEPDVTVGGFPFLTQVLREKYDKITIVMRDVQGEGVRLPRLDVEATNVTASMRTLMGGEGDVVAERVTGTATIGYA
jgi:LmeA-like phospholipid-binding